MQRGVVHAGGERTQTGFYGQGRLRIRRTLLILVSAGVGAGLMFIALRRTEQPKLLGTAPEKFIPAQTLTLLDGRQQEFGKLSVSPDGVIGLSLSEAKQHLLVTYAYGQGANGLFLYGELGTPSHLNVQ